MTSGALTAKMLTATISRSSRQPYFLYHAWTDALLCLRLAMAIPEIDAGRVAVGGSSQGGGTALAMAALNGRVAACIADVPSYYKRIVTQTASGGDLAAFLRRYPHKMNQVYRTMSYFDELLSKVSDDVEVVPPKWKNNPFLEGRVTPRPC